SIAVLQVHTKATKNRALNLDSMMLAALVANIGALPVLTEAERHAEVFANPTFLDVSINRLSGKIGEGIMKAWGFEPEFIQVAKSWQDLSVQTETISYLDLIRLGAVLAGKFDSGESELFEAAVAKKIVPNVSLLLSDEFKEYRDSAKHVFG
ncbi:MAG: histidine kinase, partial [Paraglaciecola sp.]|nr:histidine kinase [Paraglaciecola sp.]